MGCGSSTPSDDDGAAYRAEVIVYDAADAVAGGGAHDGGKADVAQKIAEIEASVGRFDKALAEIKANGGHPLPGSELAKHAAEEATNAVGALFTIASNLQTQIDDMIARKASKEAVEEVRQALAEANRLLLAARNMFQACKLEIPARALAMAEPEAYAKLQVANSLDGTMQQVLGALVLEAEAKTKRPAADEGGGGGGGDDGGMAAAAASTAITLPSGEVRLDVWDHGEIATEEEAAKRVEAVAGKEWGYFLISKRPKGFKGKSGGVGEFWLSISDSFGSVYHFPITTDPKTKMLLVPKDTFKPLEEVNSYDGATTLHELVAALSKPGRGDDRTGDWDSDYHQLKHPAPSPESNIGGTLENPKRFASLMTIYAAARTAISGPLVRAIVKDLSEYDNAAAKHTALAGPAVMARLAAAATTEASASMLLTADQLAEMTFDANAPPPTSLHFIVYSQRQAADVSIEVYHIACDMIDAVVGGGGGGEGAAATKGAYCIPGGVKGDRRILFKSLFKYGGIFSNCRDLSRLTICVLNLTAGTILAEAIHKHPLLLVIRCKNRFAASANTSDSGGYRDFQMLCIYKRGGRHYYVEVQINLVEMVAIKAGKGGEEAAAATTGGKKSKKEATDDEMAGGHDAFNTARVIDAFSKRSLEYSGDPSDALWKMIAAGSLLRVVLDQATMTDAQVKQLVDAMASDQCRVKELSLLGCKGITTILEGLWVLMEASKARKSNPDVLDLSGWEDLRELPDSVWKLTHLKTLKLERCENLETLPETGVAGLVNLEELDLNSCGKLKQLPQSIAKLSKLKTLNLEWCENLETLPETGVAGLVNLEALNLNRCSKLKQLPQSIAKLTKLKRLVLFKCENLETLPETGVAGLVNLEELDLMWCRKLKQLPQSMAKLTKLKMLNLFKCENLDEPLPDLSHLEIKYASSASDAAKAWEKRGFTSLANFITACTGDTLNLHGACVETLPDSLGKLSHLKTLELDECDNLETLPETGVAGLVNLEELDLNHCSKLKQLPQSIAKLTKLKTLNLWDCYNLETLPETGVAGLVNLEALNLKECRKLKQLPQSIAKLAKLKTLNLGDCDNLAEPLPDLSHLLPGLKINSADRASAAAKAWKKRGFTSLAN